jgi:hypothetical protein
LSTNIELFPLARALCHLRGPWRTLTVNKITTTPLLFVQRLSDGRRLRTADLLDFSSSIGFVPYPKAELLDFATRIFEQAESSRRICTALRFVPVALQAAGEISDRMAAALVASFARRKAQRSPLEESLALRTVVDFLRTPSPIVKYLEAMMNEYRGCPGFWHLPPPLLWQPPRRINARVQSDREGGIVTILKAKRPSRSF